MISLRVDSFIYVPVHSRSLGSVPQPIWHPATTFGNGATGSLDPPASIPCGPGAPAILPCGPAHPAADRRVSTPGFRLRSDADRVLRAALPWPARALRADARGGTLAGDVRHIATI